MLAFSRRVRKRFIRRSREIRPVPSLRVYILGLPRRKLGEISKVLDNFLLRDELLGIT